VSNIIPKIYYIPEKVDYVIVSDLFAENYTGGAELTLEAILQKCPKRYLKVYSASITPELVEKYKNKYWLFVNFSQVSPLALVELVTSAVRFSVVECDYKYCKWRSSHHHKLNENVECVCETQRHGKFIRALYRKAEHVFFMGQGQMDEYNRLFPGIPSDNFVLQTSTFSDETLNYLSDLRHSRIENEKYAILKGGTWIKAQEQTVAWCEQNGIKFDLVGGLPYKEFLHKLSEYKGLVFRPAGYDTCPRVVIESKLMGLECILNENVQHKNETWFKGNIEDCEQYLRGRADFFWETVNVDEKL
jgi:hypothetical protein